MESTAIFRRAFFGLVGLVCLVASSCSLTAADERSAPPPASEVALAPATSGDSVVLHPAGAILRRIPGDHNEALGLLAPSSLIAKTGRIYRLDGVDWYEVAVREHVGWVNGQLIGDPTDIVADVLGSVQQRKKPNARPAGSQATRLRQLSHR